ncbi:MAG: response regulator [Candidatus Aureabacteria bacterium]|nr:response regulator [Candidatus Auribacterota bacterium]
MKKILIIEDDKYFLDILYSLLEEKNYEIDVAEDGMTAIKKLQGASFDIILLDRHLPEVDGEEILNLIKMQSTSPRVIVITGDPQEGTEERVMFQGADAYLEKPFELKALIKLIEKN